MADVTQITTHVDDALNRLLSQYKELTNVEGLITINATQIQELEDVSYSILEGRWLDSAIGVQLDLIGTIVDLARTSGHTDDQYRTLLYVKIGQNTSQGTAPKIRDILKLLTGASTVYYQNMTHASILLAIDTEINPNTDEQVAFVYDNMHNVSMGGVRIDYIICYSGDNDSFAFAGTNTNKPALGFGSTVDVNAGGKLAKVNAYKKPFAFDGQSKSNLGFGSLRDPLVGGRLQTT